MLTGTKDYVVVQKRWTILQNTTIIITVFMLSSYMYLYITLNSGKIE